MATRGQVELARIRQRPIFEQAQQSYAEFMDPVSRTIDFGRSLMEGYQMGEKLVEKGERYLDRQARKKFRGETGEKFKDFDEYRGYMGLDPKLQDLYDNPDAIRNRPEELEVRIPFQGESLIDNYRFGEARLLLDRDIAERNQPIDYSDPNRTDEMLAAEAKQQLALGREGYYGPIGPADGYLNPYTVNTPYFDFSRIDSNVSNILNKPFEQIILSK